MAALEREKVDPLFQAYMMESGPGQSAIGLDLVSARQQLGGLRLSFDAARRNLQNNPFSPSAQQVYAQAYGALVAFERLFELAWRTQYNVKVIAAERVLRMGYQRNFYRDLAFYHANPGRFVDPQTEQTQGAGSFRNKIDNLNATLLNPPLLFGGPGVGLFPFGPWPEPSGFPTATRIADYGDVVRVLLFMDPESVQHLEAAPPEYWYHRTSVIAASPFDYKDTLPGNVDWAGAELHLLLSMLARTFRSINQPDLITQIDQLNP
jgi:hypothetical protein